MSTQELLSKIYTGLTNKTKMNVAERCELQKLLKEALHREIEEEEKEMCLFHIGKFEEDIFTIVNKVKENSLRKLAEMEIAMNRITDAIKEL